MKRTTTPAQRLRKRLNFLLVVLGVVPMLAFPARATCLYPLREFAAASQMSWLFFESETRAFMPVWTVVSGGCVSVQSWTTQELHDSAARRGVASASVSGYWVAWCLYTGAVAAAAVYVNRRKLSGWLRTIHEVTGQDG